ncbi:MAG TPA: P-type conjugative transfer protein TrbL, partial [Accumulibacter sp.]|nr:P-type conjugative transfer protein TrbL [Accumulibacter sp.]
MRLNKSAVLVAALVLLYSTGASAELSFHDSATNQGILDRVVSEFATRAAGWQSIILAAATRLYWTLVTISMVWTFGMMALRKADIG